MIWLTCCDHLISNQRIASDIDFKMLVWCILSLWIHWSKKFHKFSFLSCLVIVYTWVAFDWSSKWEIATTVVSWEMRGSKFISEEGPNLTCRIVGHYGIDARLGRVISVFEIGAEDGRSKCALITNIWEVSGLFNTEQLEISKSSEFFFELNDLL